MASRIQKSIKNAKVNVIFYVITAALAFFSRKIFLDNLGTEFLGLSSTLGDILNLMNITELLLVSLFINPCITMKGKRSVTLFLFMDFSILELVC